MKVCSERTCENKYWLAFENLCLFCCLLQFITKQLNFITKIFTVTKYLQLTTKTNFEKDREKN